jgi:hypothetical protein
MNCTKAEDEDEEDKKKEQACAEFRFSEVKQNLDSSFVDSYPQCKKYCLMLKEVVQDLLDGQYKIGTQTKINLFFKHGFNNTK